MTDLDRWIIEQLTRRPGLWVGGFLIAFFAWITLVVILV